MSAARGFNLLEVMIAGSILGIGLLTSVPLLTFTIERSSHARKVTAGQLVADEVMERLRSEVRFDPKAQANPTVDAASLWHADVLPHASGYDSPTWTVQREGNGYRVAYAIDAPAANTDCSGTALAAGSRALPADARCATVTVEWSKPDGSPGRHVATSLLLPGI